MTKKDNTIFSAGMKLADMLDINPGLLSLLLRVGISFGFGDETVEEVCLRSGLNVNTFLLICNVYTFDGYRPGAALMHKAEPGDIVKYLHKSHDYYLHMADESLLTALEKAVEPCDEKRKWMIRKFFKDYREELAKHFEYEEKVVFPYVESVLGHKASPDYNILQYEENHSNVEEKLSDLKSIVMKYLPRECSDHDIFQVLFMIYALEDDLRKHTFIEDDILVPIVNRLEENEKE
ncbi:MAG: hemerythrin domain-containing protein [Bacteroidales bacterium]|nr:hemerythrin domain-containing protein [Bacteroidales bacterium]